MSLTVLVKSASSLPNVERFSKSDPMTVCTLLGKKKKTKVIENNLDPVWDETLQWDCAGGLSGGDVLKVEVFDHETVGKNRLLGSTEIQLQEVVSRGKHSVSPTLRGKKGDQLSSKIVMELTYTKPAGGEGGGGEGGDESDEEGEMGVMGGGGEEGEVGEIGEGGEEGGAEGEGGAEEGGTSGGTGGGSSAAARRKKAGRKAGSQRDALPNKPTDFQVRIHIHEARKLIGSGLNPVTKVICGTEGKETSTQKGTNSPVFGDLLCFNFKCMPGDMFDKVVEIKVLNAKKVLRDALIGSFRLDLGSIYDEAGHCYIHKWLLLTDPEDPSGGSRGYLKVSMQVIGPKDEPKQPPTEFSQETVDIESNLLRPSGMRLTPATLTVRVYRGEDMPQMDAGYFDKMKKLLHVGNVQKELVDPYCTVSYAGHKGKTKVIWNEEDPEWNAQINLAVRFPSMCERLRFQMKDKDKVNKDDYIGTCYLNMSQISAPGDSGFLPTFGPCFINCYGSPREFTDLPAKYEYLNKGLIEGVAYRGRVMVEVEMNLGELPSVKVEEIKLADQKKITPFLRRRKYKLFGAFFSATMVHPNDAPVEFEVSIGNYGNKLDENAPAQSSTTPPGNPTYDGTKYFYLPWMEQKPCIQVDSQWEDCLYRIEALNILLFMVDQLVEGIQQVRKYMEVENYENSHVRSMIGELLDSLSESLDQHLPPLPPQGFTRLDKLVWAQREKEWVYLQEDSEVLRRNLQLRPHQELLSEVEDFMLRLKALAVEPQNCIPDVVIWMLAGNKRVAVKRIPSHEIMYSSIAKARGKNCGKLQIVFLTPPAVKKQEELEDLKERAQLRLLLWLGLEKDQTAWTDKLPGGDVATFAETYENEACLFGRWGTAGLTFPRWSDPRGKLKQPKEEFEPVPPGWRWEGDWEKSPELSLEMDLDEGLNEWTEDIFEYQLRYPLGHWPDPSESYWADVRGDKLMEYEGKKERSLTRDEIKCPEGWVWKEPWAKDMNRAVDEEGWEYAVEAGLGTWVPYERNLHLSRRRRWVRLRLRDKDSKISEKKRRKRDKAIEEGWEFARLAHLTYHITEHKLDFARRRRWIRKLVNIKAGEKAVFRFKGKREKKKKKADDEDEEEDVSRQQVPRMYLTFKDYHTYQLRAYIYQARDMYASDKSGLSDPYVFMSFGHYSGRSRVVKESVCPTWDQTLLINTVRLYGDPESVLESPPPVVLEFYDKDIVGEDEFLGTSTAFPTVRLSLDTPAPRLDWFSIARYEEPAGELLAAFELISDEGGELPFTPPKASPPLMHYIVPSGIRPILQKTRVEILCWGVRDMKRYQLLQVTSPLVEMECGGTVVRSEHIKNTKDNPNFPQPVITFDVYLPKEELYAPPLNIRILDKRAFGRLPMVGTHIISSLKDFFVDPCLSPEEKAALRAVAGTPTVTPTSSVKSLETAVKIEEGTDDLSQDPDSAGKFEFDWWSKYYYSIGDERRTQKDYVQKGLDKMVVYPGELEDAFNRFVDLTQNFPLYRGKGSRDPEEQANQSIGFFKGGIKIYPLPDDGSPEPDKVLTNIPSSDPVDVVVRVYVIKGIDLQPQDPNGKSDPYLKVAIGSGKKNRISDKENYVTANLNPVFGKMFELPARLPIDHTLTVTVMDWDRFSADDLIGETKIDLENRYFSRFRAKCGLPETMARKGPNKWRDGELPVKILEDWVKSKNFPEPEWSPNRRKVVIDGQTYSLTQFEEGKVLHEDITDAPEQRLALYVLNQQGLVPEHVETRNLYNPLQPNISQGQLHMWVDIFEKNFSIPSPVGISPRKALPYVLRVVVWNTKDVVLDEVSVATGEAMSDIYLKGWVRGEDETQKTDVHYRSMDGEGNFNWRLVFPFDYLPAEDIIVVKKKDHFYSLTKTERHLPPIFTMQIWDNDLFNPDDFIGTVDFNLSAMPLPVSDADKCSLDQLPTADKEVATDDLFKRKRMKGWWPSYEVDDEGTRLLNGKMELEFEIVSKEEEELRPAGKARDEPNLNPALEPPNRPATSFLWFTSPWKTFKFIIWKYYKWHIIGTIIVILLIVLIVIFVYTAPNTIMNWVTSRILPG